MVEKLERYFVWGLLFVIVGATGVFCKRVLDLRREQAEFIRLAEQVRAVGCETERMEYGHGEKKDMLPEYQALWEENTDFAGWVSIHGTGIDYPVMWTPAEPEYYLYKDFHGETSFGGTPFAVGAGFDLGGEGVVFLYGHNMRTGSMFADLLKYREKRYWEKHSVICLDSLWERRQFRIFSVMYAREQDWTEPEGLFNQVKLETETQRADFLKRIRERNLYETGIEVEEGSEIVLLVTCSYQEKDGRFIVAGIRSELK